MPREADDRLFARIREVTAAAGDEIGEKAMFGGRCLLVNGNMAVGTWHENLVVRLDKADYEKNLKLPHASPFDVSGRAMKGWILVDAEGIATKSNLEKWVGRGVAYASTLPPK